MLDAFVKTYGDRRYRFPVLLNHGGVVLGFAMDEQRRIYYTVLDLADATTPMDVDAWLANPVLLPFPGEVVPVGFAATDPSALPQVKRGTSSPAAGGALGPDDVDPFLSSTARLSAACAFQVVSDGRFVYVFRQAVTDPSADDLLSAQRFWLIRLPRQAAGGSHRSRHRSREHCLRNEGERSAGDRPAGSAGAAGRRPFARGPLPARGYGVATQA